MKEIQSFSETLAEMVSNIYIEPEAITKLNIIAGEESSQMDRLQLIIEWAHEFEKINEDREWEGEWVEEVGKFLDSKLNNA